MPGSLVVLANNGASHATRRRFSSRHATFSHHCELSSSDTNHANKSTETTNSWSPTGWQRGGGGGGERRGLRGLFGQQFRVSPWVLVGINQGQFQYFSEIIKSESVGLRAMVGAQSGLFSHGGAWGQPSWSPVSSGEAWHGLNCSTHDCLI